MKSVVAHNAKRIIQDKGLRQRFVANKAGYNEKTFSNMLNDRKIIADYDIVKIATALEVEANELFKPPVPNQKGA